MVAIMPNLIFTDVGVLISEMVIGVVCWWAMYRSLQRAFDAWMDL